MKKVLLILLTLLGFGSFAQTPTATHCTVNGKGSNETGTNSVITAVADHEGNSYTVVQYGPYCWMRQNMRCTTSPSTGSNILVDNANENSFSYTGKKAYYYKNNSENSADYFGLLYNWCAAADTFNASLGETSTNVEENNALDFRFTSPRRGICPAGWHLPSKEEWTTLIGLNCASNGQYADILAGGEDWLVSLNANTPGNYDETDRASSNFDALPAGLFCPAGFYSRNKDALFWTSTELLLFANFTKANYYRLNYDEDTRMGDVTIEECPGQEYFYSDKRMAYSVRCVRDALCTGTTVVTVTFDANGGAGSMAPQNFILNQSDTLSSNQFIRNGYLFAGWSTKAEGTGSYYADGDSIALQYDLTLYANWIIPNKLCTIPILNRNEIGTDSLMYAVRDHENNIYQVVQIGNQCWLKENMRCLTLPSTGASLLSLLTATGGTRAGTKSARYYEENPTTALNGYGLFYNWYAAVDTSSASVFINRQGICPQGWHIPSLEEWNIMIATGESFSNGACYLVGGNDWADCGQTNSPGNYSVPNRNISGFSALPAGEGYQTGRSQYTCFWSGTYNIYSNQTDKAYSIRLNYCSPTISMLSAELSDYKSVRCVRN